MNKPFTAIIVDDEPPAVRMLDELLSGQENVIDIIGKANSGTLAITLINTARPDLVFLDIQLQDMLGFDVLKQLTYQPFVIFTTAHDEYAVTAFETLSVDYLLKPVKKDRLLKALDKLQYFVNGNVLPPANWQGLESLIAINKRPEAIKTLSVKKGNKFILVQLTDVLYLEAYDKYSFVYLLNGEKLFCDYMLSVLEEKLADSFIRIQKSYIVNRQKIVEIHKYSNNRFTLVLNNKDFSRLVSGPTYYKTIKETFNI